MPPYTSIFNMHDGSLRFRTLGGTVAVSARPRARPPTWHPARTPTRPRGYARVPASTYIHVYIYIYISTLYVVIIPGGWISRF